MSHCNRSHDIRVLMLMSDLGRHIDRDKSYSGEKDFPRKRTSATPHLGNQKCRKPAPTPPIRPYIRPPVALWKYPSRLLTGSISAVIHDRAGVSRSTRAAG